MPLSSSQILNKGNLAFKKGNLKKAKHFYNLILKTTPNQSDANHNLGALETSLNNHHSAKEFYKKAISNNEDSFLNKIILPYINISPTSENQISDDHIILIKEIKKNIQNKKIENVHKNITSIENYRKNFRSTFSEIEKYINFKKELSYF